MFRHPMMGNYVLMKKSTLLLAAAAAAGLVGFHYYKRHRTEVKNDISNLADDVAEVAKKGTRKAKEVVEEAKS